MTINSHVLVERFYQVHSVEAQSGTLQNFKMAICRVYHNPDYFLMMTCNPNWPEIKAGLKSGQIAQDRPNLVARVFKLKDQLMLDFKTSQMFGKVVAHMYVIEFQKHGLDILLILADNDRTLTADLVDSIVKGW